MSSILACPDYAPGLVNLAGSMKSFIVESDNEIAFTLRQGELVILDEKYMPVLTPYNGSMVSLVEIDLRAVLERLLDISIPESSTTAIEQVNACADFTACIDNLPSIVFRVLKGGVAELNSLEATPWIEQHWLTWQPQTKLIIQHAPEWLGLYPLQAGNVMVTAYFTDGTSQTGVYASLEAAKLVSVNTSWGNVAPWLLSYSSLNLQPVAWDVWYEVGGIRKTPVQRYQLRNTGDQEQLFVWANTLGGIDSVSFTGSAEQDEKLGHKNALYQDDSIVEFDLDNPREIRQSTGYLDQEQSYWIKDFFYSRKKLVVRPDGSLRPVAVINSKILSSSENDVFEYEFTYRMGTDFQVLNLDRTHALLPAPEGLADFFLTNLLSGLTEASYVDNLLMAVQSPFAIGWQKISMAQLWGGALPALIDNVTIKLINGKLTAIFPDDIDTPVDPNAGGGTASDSRTELIDGAIIWDSGLTYNSTIIHYKILGVTYTANAKTLSLQPSDPTLNRIDAFYVDQFSQLQVMTGTPGDNPSSPILKSTQLLVMTVLVEAGSLIPSNLGVEKVYDENVEWTAASEVDAYTLVDFASADNPLQGSVRAKIGITIPDTAIYRPLHFIGEAYQGGIIFWLNADGTKGLIVSVNDVATAVFYESLAGGGPYATTAHGVEIGTGKANSDLLLANPRSSGYAVKFCNELFVSGYDDWYLPSENELAEIYFRRMEIGGLSTITRWSSTEVTRNSDWQKARCISFLDGLTYTRDKNNAYAVRAIRSFDDATQPTGVPIPDYTPQTLKMKFTASGPLNVKDGVLSFNLRSTLPWIQRSSVLLINAMLGPNVIGTVAMGDPTNTFSYQSGDNTWQLVAIPLTSFAPGNTQLDGFEFCLHGSWPNNLDLAFDDIRYQFSTIDLTKSGEVITDYHFMEDYDGERIEFTTSRPFAPGTTRLYRNGMIQHIGPTQDYTEVNGKILLDYPLEPYEKIMCTYTTL